MQIKNSLITAALMSFALAASAQVPSKNVPVPNKNLKTGETLRNVSAPIQEKIFLEDFTEWLCPKHLLRGDREFGGNGPKIKCEVSLRIGDNGGSLWADFYIWRKKQFMISAPPKVLGAERFTMLHTANASLESCRIRARAHNLSVPPPASSS